MSLKNDTDKKYKSELNRMVEERIKECEERPYWVLHGECNKELMPKGKKCPLPYRCKLCPFSLGPGGMRIGFDSPENGNTCEICGEALMGHAMYSVLSTMGPYTLHMECAKKIKANVVARTGGTIPMKIAKKIEGTFFEFLVDGYIKKMRAWRKLMLTATIKAEKYDMEWNPFMLTYDKIIGADDNYILVHYTVPMLAYTPDKEIRKSFKMTAVRE